MTGHALSLLIRINGLNRSNSGSPTTPASARKRCNAGSECGKKTHSDCDKLCDMPESDSQTFMHTRHCIGVKRSQSYTMHAMPPGIVLYPGCAERNRMMMLMIMRL